MHVKGTVLVRDLLTGSRIRMELGLFNSKVALAKQNNAPCRYVAEEDQECEGLSLPDAVKARAAQKSKLAQVPA